MEVLPQLLTINQAAKRLGLSHEATRRHISSGDLPVVNVARKGAKKRALRVSVEDLQAFIIARTRRPDPSPELPPSMRERLEAARAAR